MRLSRSRQGSVIGSHWRLVWQKKPKVCKPKRRKYSPAPPGPLTDGPLSPTRRAVGLDAYPGRLFPAKVSRATVAAWEETIRRPVSARRSIVCPR